MPLRNSWLLPREGFTGDALIPLVKNTIFNPALTLPLLLLARYTKRGEDLSILHEKAFKRFKVLAWLSVLRVLNGYLNRGALDNWVRDATYDWQNREVVVVTGGAGGIGGAIVRLLAERGIKVAVLDVIPMTFETPSNVSYYQCDITSSSAIAAAAAEIRTTLGSPTVLINNAGVARGKYILEATEKDVRFTFDVNTVAHYLLAREFVPAMAVADHGMVVTVASMASYVTAPRMVDYAASKAAALVFHEGLAAELRTRYAAPRVRTVVVNQGYTKTALFQGWTQGSTFLVPALEVDSVAEAVVRAVLAGRSDQIFLPRFGGFLSGFRGWSHWLQLRVRNDSKTLMEKWNGRQVIDVERDYKLREEGDTSGSTVLVPPASEQ